MKAAFFACEKSNLMIILLCEQRGQTEECIFGLSFLLVLCFLNELLFAGEMIFSLSIFNS